MSHRRDSTDHTRQKDVAPGDQTGVYYITLCNLPFNTSWQRLKDFTRNPSEVDHVEVFRNSTSGWVRVLGRENFELAWDRLDRGVLDGRSIVASDRNATQPIKIRELVDLDPDLSGDSRYPCSMANYSQAYYQACDYGPCPSMQSPEYGYQASRSAETQPSSNGHKSKSKSDKDKKGHSSSHDSKAHKKTDKGSKSHHSHSSKSKASSSSDAHQKTSSHETTKSKGKPDKKDTHSGSHKSDSRTTKTKKDESYEINGIVIADGTQKAPSTGRASS